MMTERKKADDKDQSAIGDPSQGGESSKKPEENNEWLRDQVGEDGNLSGSSTYRTLPDQPAEDDTPDDLDGGTQDTKDRQSKR